MIRHDTANDRQVNTYVSIWCDDMFSSKSTNSLFKKYKRGNSDTIDQNKDCGFCIFCCFLLCVCFVVWTTLKIKWIGYNVFYETCKWMDLVEDMIVSCRIDNSWCNGSDFCWMSAPILSIDRKLIGFLLEKAIILSIKSCKLTGI